MCGGLCLVSVLLCSGVFSGFAIMLIRKRELVVILYFICLPKVTVKGVLWLLTVP